MNAAAVELLRTIMQQFVNAPIILAGVIEPASDGYVTDKAVSSNAAFSYHRDQAAVLAGPDVDLLYAPTFPAFSELSGTILDGMPLADAPDADISPAPRHYMIGCLYPTHAQTALRALRASRPDLVQRVRGLKANASPLSPEELDKLDHLGAGMCA